MALKKRRKAVLNGTKVFVILENTCNCTKQRQLNSRYSIPNKSKNRLDQIDLWKAPIIGARTPIMINLSSKFTSKEQLSLRTGSCRQSNTDLWIISEVQWYRSLVPIIGARTPIMINLSSKTYLIRTTFSQDWVQSTV